MSTNRKVLAGCLAVVLLLLLLAILFVPTRTVSHAPSPGSLGTPDFTQDPAPSEPSIEPTGKRSLLATGLLSSLVVSVERPDGYRRELFRLWIDADRNGCDTRREVLIAESMTSVEVGPRCSVAGGSWYSAYDGLSFSDPGELDIDHLVPLAEAWRSGADGWDAARHEAFANDLGDERSLIAVSAGANRSKGDRDPAEWMPPLADYACTYASDWVVVKTRWQLDVDEIEKSALADILEDCPDELLEVGTAP